MDQQNRIPKMPFALLIPGLQEKTSMTVSGNLKPLDGYPLQFIKANHIASGLTGWNLGVHPGAWVLYFFFFLCLYGDSHKCRVRLNAHHLLTLWTEEFHGF